jgi:hypothetical protein
MRTSALAVFLIFSAIVFSMPAQADIVINEINPWGAVNEWVELYNSGNESVSIGNWTIETAISLKDATLPENSTIPAKGFFVAGDNTSGNDYNETITISDTAVFVALRNNENQTMDSVNLSNFFVKNETLSIQRKNATWALSNDTSNWAMQIPTKGSENFPKFLLLEITSISGPEKILVNQRVLINVSVSNTGEANGEYLALLLNSSSDNQSQIFNISALSSRIISFNWTANSSGNITLCSSVENSTLCKEFNVTIPPEKFAVLSIKNNSFTAGKEYDSLFEIEIENKSMIEGSCAGKDNVTVSYNISELSSAYSFLDNFTVEVGCSRTAGTGKWTIPTEGGNYTLCVRIINSNSKFTESEACQTISVNAPEESTCNLTIAIESKTALADGESDQFNITVNNANAPCPDCSVEITYSVENSSGIFLQGYPKITNKTVGQKNTFSFTPSLDCGAAIYRLKANITKYSCNDTFTSDNFAQVLINITGKTPICTPPASKEPKKPAPVYSGGGGSGLSASPSSGTIVLEIIFLKSEVMKGEEFTSSVSVKNTGDKLLPITVYSYAYDGKNCITGSWTANQMNLSLGIGETRTISLKNKIEEGTNPGEYIFRFRAKVDSKNYDKDSQIIVLDRSALVENLSFTEESVPSENKTYIIAPDLKVWSDTKLRINLTNCEGCMMNVLGPNINVTTDKKYRVFEVNGSYNIFVTKNSTVILNQAYDFNPSITAKAGNNESAVQDETDNTGQEALTGNFAKSNGSGGFFGWLASFFGNLFSPILSMMNSSLAK